MKKTIIINFLIITCNALFCAGGGDLPFPNLSLSSPPSVLEDVSGGPLAIREEKRELHEEKREIKQEIAFEHEDKRSLPPMRMEEKEEDKKSEIEETTQPAGYSMYQVPFRNWKAKRAFHTQFRYSCLLITVSRMSEFMKISRMPFNNSRHKNRTIFS